MRTEVELDALNLLVEVSKVPRYAEELNQMIVGNKQRIKLGGKCFGSVEELADFLGRREEWVAIAENITRRISSGDSVENAIIGALGITPLKWEYGENEMLYNCPCCGRVLLIQVTKDTQFIGHSEEFCRSHAV